LHVSYTCWTLLLESHTAAPGELIGHNARWETYMTTASDLLQQHIQTLVDDNERWQTLIADDLLWELAYAPAIGHPARLSGREEVVRHVKWFL